MPDSATVRARYDRLAGLFDWLESHMGQGHMGKWRCLQWSRVTTGRVLEVGVGAGASLQFYPSDADVVAIDLSPKMLERAKRRALVLGRRVELQLADVQALDFETQTFDCVVASCVFCSVPEPALGLAEIRRVLKPEGSLILLEHVRSEHPLLGRLMDLLNPLVVWLVGANINRRTLESLPAQGFTVEHKTPLDPLNIFWLIQARPIAERGQNDRTF